MTVLGKPGHRHKAVRSHRTIYLGPVSHRATPEAQGGISKLETCKCGAQRRINVNGENVEKGAWLISEFIRSMLK